MNHDGMGSGLMDGMMVAGLLLSIMPLIVGVVFWWWFLRMYYREASPLSPESRRKRFRWRR